MFAERAAQLLFQSRGSRDYSVSCIAAPYEQFILAPTGVVMNEARKPKVAPISIDRARESLAAGNGEIYRLLINSVRDYAIFVLDPEGRVLTWNPGAQAMKGYKPEEIIGQHFSKFYPEDAVQSGWPTRELQLAEKEGRFSDEGWRVRKDGTSFWASVVITALKTEDDTLTGFAKVTNDLTERRQTEERVQQLNSELRQRISQLDESRRVVELRTIELQKLSSQLLQVQDEERRRIARELHDDLGQQMSAIKMLLASNVQNDEVSKMVDSAADSVRNLSYLLHPPLLDETGLRAALHWYVDGMVKRSGIQIALSVSPHTFPRLSRDIEMTIFRVVQESLTNVYRHAATDSARVEIEKQADWIIARVRDYGRGLPREFAGPGSSGRLGVGISGMRERVRQLGGELSVSRAEPGTVLEAKIPLFSTNFFPDL
jgi:PAS domain S-box-containing protein